MRVTFSPAVCETVTVVSSALFPQQQTSPVLFSAKLSAHDYAQLVASGGSIQLWSNIYSLNDRFGSWSEHQFLDSTRLDDDEHFSAYILNDNYTTSRINDQHDHTFLLPIALPALGESQSRHFSFTYRIVYHSGHIVWLGQFEQDGHLILEAQPEGSLNDLSLSSGWSIDNERGAYVRQCEGKEDPVELATVQSPSDFHICGLSGDRLAGSLQNSSVLFLIPRAPSKLPVLRPTYILSAFANIYMSVSPNGLTITSSGSGSVLLQVKDYLEDAREFTSQVISRCNLDKWNIVGGDMKQAVALASTADPTLPIRGKIISFWPSDHLSQFVALEASYFGKALTDHEVDHFAILPLTNEWMHVVPTQTSVLLKFHVYSSDFTVTPVHRLKQSSKRTSHREWAVAILSGHTSVLTPYPSWSNTALPTPPASPSVSRIHDINFAAKSSVNLFGGTERMTPGFEDSYIPDDEARNKGGEVREVTQIPGELKDLREPADDLLQNLDDFTGDRTEQNLATGSNDAANTYLAYIRYGRSIIWILQCLFASLFNILAALLGLGPVSDLGASLSIHKWEECLKLEDERSEDDVTQVTKLVSTSLDQGFLGHGDTADELQASPNRTISPKDTAVGPVHLNGPVPTPEDHIFYANIHQYELNNSDDDPVPATAVVDVVLFPLPDGLNGPQNYPSDFVSPDSNSSLYNAIRTAVAFIDRDGPLSCVIDRLQFFWCPDEDHVTDGGDAAEVDHPVSLTSFLLQYRLDTADRNREILVRVETPEA